MVDYSTISIVFTGLSISIAAFYYISTLRNTRKNQDLQLETRQAQLFMQIYRTWSSRETINIRKELQNWEWTDYDDFIRKYGPESNPEAWTSFQELANFYEGIGVLINRQLIDPAFVDDLMSGATLWGWETFGEIVKDFRVRANAPYFYEFWEYLYNAVSAIAHEQHPELKT
jgi:hypothetical protein